MAVPVFDPNLPTVELQEFQPEGGAPQFDPSKPTTPLTNPDAAGPQFDPAQPSVEIADPNKLPTVTKNIDASGTTIGDDTRTLFGSTLLRRAADYANAKLDPVSRLWGGGTGSVLNPTEGTAKSIPMVRAGDIAAGRLNVLLPGATNPETGESYRSQSTPEDDANAPLWAKIATGALRGGATTVDGVAPWVVAGGPISAIGKAPLAGRALSALFAADMVRNVPAQAKQFIAAVEHGDVQGAVESGVEGTLGAFFTYQAAKHAVARQQIPKFDAQGNPIIDPKTGEQAFDYVGIAEETPAIRSLLTKKISQEYSPEALRDMYQRVNRGEATPAEEEMTRFINQTFESPGQAIREGVRKVTSEPRMESQFWRDYLGLKPGQTAWETLGGKSPIIDLTKGKANANATVSEQGRVLGERGGTDEVGKTPVEAGSSGVVPGAASSKGPEFIQGGGAVKETPKQQTIAKSLGLKSEGIWPQPTGNAYGFTLQTPKAPVTVYALGDLSEDAVKRLMQAKVSQLLESGDLTRDDVPVALRPPTPAQAEANNAPTTSMDVHGLDIAITHPVGSIRKGNDATGKEWQSTVPANYGHIRGVKGADGDELDVYVGPNPKAPTVYVIDQIDPKTGKFNEHKAMLAFDSPGSAVKAYDAAFSDGSGPSRRGSVTAATVDQFKQWIKGDTTKPIAEATKAAVTKPAIPETKATKSETVSPPASTKQPEGATKTSKGGTKWRSIGTNSRGNEIFEDDSGVRSYVEKGIRVTEPVEIIPTRAGVVTQPRTDRSKDYLPVEKTAVVSESVKTEPVKPTAKTGEEIKPEPKAGAIGDLTDADLDKLLDEATSATEKPKSAQPRTSARTARAPRQPQAATPKAEPTTPKEKSAADILSDAAKEGIKGADEAMKGLHKLFGGGKHMGSGGPSFDEKTYQEAKPHFEKAYESAKKSGKSLMDFFKFIFKTFGEAVRPYLKRFVQDMQALEKQGQKGEVTTDERPVDQRKGSAEGRNPATTGKPGGTGGVSGGGQLGGDQSQTPEAVGGERPTAAEGARSPGPSSGSPAVSGGERTDTSSATRDERDQRRAESPPVIASENYRITDADQLGKGTPKRKAADNIAAIKLVKLLEAEKRPPTTLEQSKLVRYVGWGGVKGVFDEANQNFANERAELKKLLTPEEYDGARRSIQDAHYTSQTVIEHGLYNAMRQFGFRGGRMVEGGVGIGNMIGLLPDDMRGRGSYVGIERDPLTAKIATYLYPKARILQQGFQEADLTKGGFDGSVGNPPFGKKSIYDKRFKAASKFTIHNYFIAKTLELTRPGGVNAFVVSRYFLDNSDPTAREHIDRLGEFLGAIRLPSTAFKENANTEVITDLVFFRRRDVPEGHQPSDWTKVSEWTDPKSGNTWKVNKWIVDHPEMILGEMWLAGHGLYGKEELGVTAPDSQDLGADLDKAVLKLPQDVYTEVERQVKDRLETQVVADAPDNVRVGSYFVKGKKLFRRLPDVNGQRQAQSVETLKPAQAERVREMITVRDLLNELIKSESSYDVKDTQIAELRRQLNKAYDDFTADYGYLSSTTNRRAFFDDTDSMRILGLETDYSRGISPATAKLKGVQAIPPSAKKADIFSKRVNQPYQEITHVDTPKEALMVSLNQRGGVDIEHMKDLTGLSEAELIKELGDLVFKNPREGWESREQYLAGNVRQKYQEALDAAIDDPTYRRNAEALKGKIPADIPALEIIAPVGAPWVAATDVAKFAEDLTGITPKVVFYRAVDGGWNFKHDGSNTASTERWGTKRMDFGDIMAQIMNGKPTIVWDRNSDDQRIVNEEQTALATAKAEEIRTAWSDWIWKDAERRERLGRVYNDRFNNYADATSDGSHLSLPGTSTAIQLRIHQKNVAWRMITKGGEGLMMDHVVGAGKTYAIVAGTMELRRLGRVRKWLVTVPNHLTGQWRDAYAMLYPNSNILAAGPSDFSKDNRQRLFSKILTGGFDAVILGHSSLKKVGTSPEVEKQLLKEVLDEIIQTIEEMKKAEGSGGKKGGSRQVAQMEKRKDNLEAKLQKLSDMGARDTVASFEEMGFDGLVVDEAHEFKNLFYTTQMQNVAGLGTATGSDRAFDLYLKTRYLRRQYGGKAPIVFATGIPISNSLVEMFTMQRYLQPEVLDQMGLKALDPWARVFADIKQVYEVDPTGTGYRMATRFANFQNVGELTALYKAFADVISNADLQAQAAAEGKRFPVPKMKGGKPNNIVVKRTPEQAEFFGIPTQQLDEENNPVFDANGAPVVSYPKGTILWRVDNMPDDPREDNMLKLTFDARRAGLDVRLVNFSAPDRPESKVNKAVSEITRVYKAWADRKGTQLVFCDLSVPASARGKATKRALGEPGEIYFRAMPSGLEIVPDAQPVELSAVPEYQFFAHKTRDGWTITERSTGQKVAGSKTKAQAIKSANDYLEQFKDRLPEYLANKKVASEQLAELKATVVEQEKPATDEEDGAEVPAEEGVSVDELLADQSKFSVYDDMRTKLIAAGIPAHEIAFIHDYDSPEKKMQLFRQMNDGDIRILFGSTPKLGAGTNVQKRLVALHHLDAPWKPSDLEQREGRIIRQGNIFYQEAMEGRSDPQSYDTDPEAFAVEVNRYASDLTYDARMWQLIEHKALGLEGFRKADRNTRVIEDVGGEAANAADMKAAASGNPLIRDELELRNQRNKLELLRRAFNRNRVELENRALYLQDFTQRYESSIHATKALIATRDANTKRDDKGAMVFEMTMPDGNTTDEKGTALSYVVDMLKEGKRGYMGKYRGFDFSFEPYESWGGEKGVAFYPDRKYLNQIASYVGDEKLTGVGLFQKFDNWMSKFEDRLTDAERQRVTDEQQLKEITPELKKEFPKADDLTRVTREHELVRSQLMAANRAKTNKPAAKPEEQKSLGPVVGSPISADEAKAVVEDALGEMPDNVRFIDDPNETRGLASMRRGMRAILTLNLAKIDSPEQARDTLMEELIHAVWDNPAIAQARSIIEGLVTEADTARKSEEGYNPNETEEEAANERTRRIFDDQDRANIFLRAWRAISDFLRRLFGFAPRDPREAARAIVREALKNHPTERGGTRGAEPPQDPEDSGFSLADIEFEGEKALANESGVPTQVFGRVDTVLNRPRVDRAAGAPYAKQVFDRAGVNVTQQPNGLWELADQTPNEEAGQRLLEELRTEIARQNQPDQTNTGNLGNLLNSVVANMTQDSATAFSEPLRTDLYAVAQGERSQRGINLAVLAGFAKTVNYVARNVRTVLNKTYSDAFGGETVSKIMQRVLTLFRQYFTDEEVEAAMKNVPELGDLVNRIIALNRQDEGGRVYRRAQGLLKPKRKPELAALKANARVEEAVREILAQLKGQGVEPSPTVSAKLDPVDRLLMMIEPKNARRINQAIEAAVSQAERNAGIKASLADSDSDDEREEMLRSFDEGSDPSPEMVEKGLDLPEYRHWKILRDNLLDYSPVTLKLVQDVVKGDFKGTKFNPAKTVQNADTRLNLNELAVKPEEEVARVLKAYYDQLSANMDLTRAKDETKTRVMQVVKEQVTAQLEAARKRARDPMFTQPTSVTFQKTAQQQLSEKLAAGLFKDERLDLPAMVDRVGAKGVFRRLTPSVAELVRRVLETPFYRQGELAAKFASLMVDQFGVSPEDAKRAEDVFRRAFNAPMERARKSALAQVEKTLTPQERREATPKKALWKKLSEAVNAGLFDNGTVLQRIAKVHGWNIPTDEQVGKMRAWAERMDRLKELTRKELDSIGTDPLDLERARRDKESATLDDRVAIKKQIETQWARWTHPLGGWPVFGPNRANIAQAINEMTSANLLFRVSFVPRQFIDVLTQGGVHTPTRAIGTAFERWAGNREAGRNTRLWEEISVALQQAYKARLASYGAAITQAREALAGTGEARNVDRLMSRIAVFERATQKADEYAAKGDHARAAVLRLFAFMRMGYRVAQAMDNLHGVPAEFQEMRAQVFDKLRENGASMAEATKGVDEVFGDMKAEWQLAIGRAQEIFDASGLPSTPQKLRAAAWNMVKDRAYQRMREMGMPADDFAEENRILRSTVGWNERTTGGIGGAVAGSINLFRGVLSKAGVPFPLGAFSNAIGTSINRSLSFTPLGFFPSAFGGDPFYRSPRDRAQRKVEAGIGSSAGLLMFLLTATGVVIWRNSWPKDPEERAMWEKQGHRPGTVEITLPDGSFIPLSTTVGPLNLLRPYGAAGGAIHDLMTKREAQQARMNSEAAKRGLTPGKIKDLSVSDLLAVAANTAWGSIMGGRTAAGLIGAVTDYGTPNLDKTTASLISPLLPGVPALQEFSRMAGVRVNSQTGDFFDFLIPLPSAKSPVNMLGDKVGTESDLQRIVQIMTGGTYAPISPAEVGTQTAYSALFSTGYRPPSINPGKGYAIGGDYRPMTREELATYTQNRGEYLKEELSGLGEAPTLQQVQQAYRSANTRALQSAGVATEPASRQTQAVGGGIQASRVGLPAFGRVSARASRSRRGRVGTAVGRAPINLRPAGGLRLSARRARFGRRRRI